MSRAMITEAYLTDIANAIRAKNGSSDSYTPPQMAAAIEALPEGGITPTGTVQITQNGTHDVTQYANANVNVGNSNLIAPDYQGLCYSYIATNGSYFQDNTGQIYFSSYYHILPGYTYVFFVGETVSDRLRIHFYAGKQIRDFETYIGNSLPNQAIYTCTHNITGGQDLTGDRLKERVFYTPSQEGEIVMVTSRSSIMAFAYCVRL